MDAELIAYLDERFHATTEQFASLHTEIGGLRSDVNTLKSDVSELKVDVSELKSDVSTLKADVSGLKADVGALQSDVGSLRQEFTSFREETTERFAVVQEDVHQTRILVEATQGDVRLIAEAFLSLNEKVDRHHSESVLSFDQVKGMIEPYYRDLDRRVRVIEDAHELRRKDVFEAVREVVATIRLESEK